MKLLRTFCMTTKRVLSSKGFIGACAGLVFTSLLNIYQELTIIDGMETSVLYLYEVETHADFWILSFLFAAIPGSVLFCSDWENRFIRFSIVRSSKINYGVATAAACFFSALLTVLIGEGLFILILRFCGPFVPESDVGSLGLSDTVYAGLMNEPAILLFFLIRILMKAFCAAFTSTFALWLSTKITNVFVTLTSPIILFYLLENLGVILKLPRQFQISTLAKGHVIVGSSLLFTLLYPVLLFTFLGAVFGALFSKSAKERVENG